MTLAAYLPDIPVAVARVSRLVFGVPCEALFPSSVFVLAGASKDSLACPWHHLQLETASGSIELVVAANEFPEIDLATSSESSPATLALIAYIVFEPLVQCLDKIGIKNSRCVRLTRWSEPQNHIESDLASWLTLHFGDGRRIPFRPLVFPETLNRLGADGVRAHRPICYRRQGLAMVLCWPVTVRLASIKMSVEQMRCLSNGDVVVTSIFHTLGPDCVVDVFIGDMNGQHLTFVGSINERSITIQGVLHMSNEENKLAEDALTDSNAIVGIDELSIPIHFLFDAPPMRTADIDSLRPGYIMELKSSTRQVEVRMVAFGQSIGTAELAVVGDRLGARILHLAEHYERPATH